MAVNYRSSDFVAAVRLQPRGTARRRGDTASGGRSGWRCRVAVSCGAVWLGASPRVRRRAMHRTRESPLAEQPTCPYPQSPPRLAAGFAAVVGPAPRGLGLTCHGGSEPARVAQARVARRLEARH